MRKISIMFLSIMLLAVSWARAGEPKFVILGYDGMDIRLIQKYMAEGLMPNMQKISQQGQLSRLDTTNPSESPVAWASFAIGANPGKTGIYDFLRRMPGSYYPEFATVSASTKPLMKENWKRWGIALGLGAALFLAFFFLLRIFTKKLSVRLATGLAVGVLCGGAAAFAIFKWVPRELPVPVSNRQGTAFWKIASDAGILTKAIRVPVTFPTEDLKNGEMLAGLGVPDIRQTNGTYTVYSTQKTPLTDTEMGGKLVQISVMGDRVEDAILGPKNFTVPQEDKPDVRVPFTAKINRADKSADITVQGKTQNVKLGQYSNFFEIEFALNPLISIEGIAKFSLLAVEPDVRIYLTPVNFSPAKPPSTLGISAPYNYAPKLAERLGLFKTIGWQEETWALNERQIDEDMFLDDLFMTLADTKKIIMSELAAGDWRLFIGVSETPDRLQHMFWRYLDPQHPLYNAEEAKIYERSFAKLYHEIDTMVGDVADKYVDADTSLIVMSDHGFQSFRKAVNINTWLVENGFMSLKGQENVRDRNLQDLFGHGEFWPNVDWSRTKAYSIGLGDIYLNLFDREPQGIVQKAEYEKIQNEIREKLRAYRDPEDGRPVVIDVYKRQDLYHGPAFDTAPDLVIGFNEGYRISWQTSLGGIPKGVIYINDRKWSGDHCSIDPSIMAGIFLSNRKTVKNPHIYDIAPTVLKSLGLPPFAEMDGTALY